MLPTSSEADQNIVLSGTLNSRPSRPVSGMSSEAVISEQGCAEYSNAKDSANSHEVCSSQLSHDALGYEYDQPFSTLSCKSLVDGLLFDIYDHGHYPYRESFDSDTFTECSNTSDAYVGRHEVSHAYFEPKHGSRYTRQSLSLKDIDELQKLVFHLQHRVSQWSAILIRQLKRRDRRRCKSHRSFDIITAILHAASLKRRIDARIRFSVEPLPGESAFQQWRDAMKAVARLPLGIPLEFRRKMWLALAEKHIADMKLDWAKIVKCAFNDRSNPDDSKLDMQIVKDLHRTGCSSFNGHDNEDDRTVLKRVLLAYARWNKKIGYCQGFNVIAALILDVMERKEEDTLKVMILLIDHVLPESYFANNLRALSVDMAVFRDLLSLHHTELSRHLDYLQNVASDESTGANYEPPLTNVFTMQWFLTLFATCLPKATALRVWDAVLLEGSEILFRTALAIWGKLQKRIMAVQTADEFYMTMGLLTQQLLSDHHETIMDVNSIIKTVYSMDSFPMSHLAELREKYTYNITPFTASIRGGPRQVIRGGISINVCSDDDDWNDDDIVDQINCFAGIFPAYPLTNKSKPGETDSNYSNSVFDVSKASPGAFGSVPNDGDELNVDCTTYQERMTMDINMLTNQYRRLRNRQKQDHVIVTAADIGRRDQNKTTLAPGMKSSASPKAASIESTIALNHLFIGSKRESGRTLSGSSSGGGSSNRRENDITRRGSRGDDTAEPGACQTSGHGKRNNGLCSARNNTNCETEEQEEDAKPATTTAAAGQNESRSDPERSNHYLTQMLFTRQKKTLLQSSAKDAAVSFDSNAGTPVLSKKSALHSTNRIHNPFQIRMNANRTKNGVKLGLYSSNNVPFARTVKSPMQEK